MTMAQVFPAILIVLDLGAAVVYAVEPNWRMTVYWLCAAILTTVVTF